MAGKDLTILTDGGTFVKASRDGFSATVYLGDEAVLLAFDLKKELAKNLAGFAIRRTPPAGKPVYIKNRLNFTKPVTAFTTPEQRSWTSSYLAPFQKFRWVDYPPTIIPGDYLYEITTRYFKKSGSLMDGPSVDLSFEMTPEKFGNFEIGFTRGYLSSQAYADRFHNAPIRPKGVKTLDFNTSKFAKRYEWLGFHARKMIFDFLAEAIGDQSLTVDLFAYDLDEPDFVRSLAQLGNRLRAFLDNASLHTDAGAVEPQARKILEESAGTDHVKVGHFKRFAHNKVLIQKRGGQAIKVLTGSANFSVRGLYVQANNVLLFTDGVVAGLYERAFEQAFNDKTKTLSAFQGSDIASRYFDIKVDGCPDCSVAFAPHQNELVSLGRVSDEIKKANSSVFFALMDLSGSGPVLDTIRNLGNQKVFTYGVTQSSDSLHFFKPGSKRSRVVPFAYLKDKVPKPFKAEWSGGPGQVIHHKFVVVDFNDSGPVVFTGSSNLAAGGEESNGDNLIAIFDRGIATAYGVEAVRLLDHYHFRAAMQSATKIDPLILQDASAKKKWWAPYYDQRDIKYQDRLLFSK